MMDSDEDEQHFSYYALRFAIVSAEATMAEIEKWERDCNDELMALQADDDVSDHETYSSDLITFHDELERLEVEVELDDLELEKDLKELQDLEPENVHDDVNHQNTTLDSFQLIVDIEKWGSENDKVLVDDDVGSDENYQHDLEVLKDEQEMLELEIELEELDGIPPSPRTWIEGTLNVKAEHKGTGYSEKITSTDDICISQDEPERLKNEVEMDDLELEENLKELEELEELEDLKELEELEELEQENVHDDINH